MRGPFFLSSLFLFSCSSPHKPSGKIIRHFFVSLPWASAAVGAIAVGLLLELLVSCAGFINYLLALRVMDSFFLLINGGGS